MTTLAIEHDQLAEQLRAAADPTRLAILDLLRRRDQCVCHIIEELELKQSVISHHLGVLRRAGLVSSYPHPNDRRWLYYQLNWDALDDLLHRLDGITDRSDYDPAPMPCPIDAPPSEVERGLTPGGRRSPN